MTWKWFTWGKHPGVADFICAGDQTPLFQRFSKWVDNGFGRIGTSADLRRRHCSWRFWTKGAANEVVCGLVRNSSDSYGRSFPLLYLGTGELSEWSSNSTLLPFAFEAVWKSFEYVAAARYDTVKRLNETLQLIQPPAPDWRDFQRRIYGLPNLHIEANYEEIVEGQKRLFKIDCDNPEKLPHNLNFCNNVMTRQGYTSPTAVFIGEVDDRIAVATIDNVLTPADFTWLWSFRTETEPKTLRK